MSVYFVEGHLGGGKSVQCVGRLIAYAEQGRRIAGNIDINLDKLCQDKRSRQSYIRIPDIPTGDDLKALGRGSESRAEDTFGALVLDECAVYLNSRNWQDKGRQSIMAWLVHARKYRWDVFIIIQSVDALDSQIRKLLHEYTVDCMRLDKLTIPFLTRLTGIKPPKLFVGRVYYGRMNPPIRSDTWYALGWRAFECYDTEQEIIDQDVPRWGGDGSYCMLPNWHRVGRFLPAKRSYLGLLDDTMQQCFLWFMRLCMLPVYLLNVGNLRGKQKTSYAID
ncbi:zonular occludens toxin domain-containing protein [Aquitalea aquatilis]|uniref:zonular occludens toxin domain-containing protein n=1 Tax=Aquitalea aquatilis TaxID=1537400 RepID=UPI0010BE184A|nr:zonular occludens toxin domain-containing protein [Aquitalea aquatilis]